jgi:hypothetical protein
MGPFFIKGMVVQLLFYNRTFLILEITDKSSFQMFTVSNNNEQKITKGVVAFSILAFLLKWDRVKIEGYRGIDLLHKNRHIDNGHIDNDVIKFSINPKMDIDMSKNGHIVKKKPSTF